MRKEVRKPKIYLRIKRMTKKARIMVAIFLMNILIFATLPAKEAMGLTGWAAVVLLIILYVIWTGMILSEPMIVDIVKDIVAIGFFILIAWLFVRYSNARWSQLNKVFFNFEVMNKADPMSKGGSGKITNWILMRNGLLSTINIFFFSAVLATVFGLMLAIVRKVINDRILNIVIVIFVDICRALPTLVVLIIVYSALPYTGIILSPKASGIMTMGIMEGAYLSETIRAGINSIHAVQSEASRALGLSSWQTMRLVILPQALKVIIPPYTSSLVGLMKGTALCSTITIYEMIKTAQQIQTWYANPTPLVVATIGYLLLLLPMTKLSSIFERRIKIRK